MFIINYSLSVSAQTMVYLEHAENLSFDQDRLANAQILQGNVIFRHDEMMMYCDSAYFYEGTNSLDAFGHIRFEQGDTLRGFGDLLFYDGNTKLARMRQHVRLVHGREDENPTILTTDTLNYDRRNNIAYYYSGGEVRDSLNTLTSIRGNYRPQTNQAVFSQDVTLVNPKFTLTSDTLLYNTETKIADIISPSKIVYEKETTIHSSLGWYNTVTERSMLLDRSVIVHADGKMMTGDTIFYDKAIGFGQVLHHLEMRDSAQHATLYGEYGEMWEDGNHGFATDSALMIDWSDSLHLAYIHADTLFTEELAYTDSMLMADSTITDSTYRRVRAHHGVRVYRDDMQMVCDSMVYLGSDSTIYLYTDPICWSDNQQISADSMRVFIVNGVIDHAVGIKNALCVMNDTLDIFNQMSGKELTAYLIDGEVRIVDVSGNALTVASSLPLSSQPYYVLTTIDRYGNESEPVAFNAPHETPESICKGTISMQDGQLTVPADRRAEFLVFDDMQGRTVLSIRYTTRPSLEQLSPGTYTVRAIYKKGKGHRLGTLLWRPNK